MMVIIVIVIVAIANAIIYIRIIVNCLRKAICNIFFFLLGKFSFKKKKEKERKKYFFKVSFQNFKPF